MADASLDRELGGVVVHWNDENGLARLLGAWPATYPLVVVDNSGNASLDEELDEKKRARVHLERPGRNLGFGGGVNRGVRRLRRLAPGCRFLLILNPDAAPEEGAVEALHADAERLCAQDGRCAGLAPALRGEDGETQHRWQLQPLPSARTLLGQLFFLGGERGPREEPPAGAIVEQPAAAVLLLDLNFFDSSGDSGRIFDPGFFPAWFDDVDLARRLATRELHFRYAPAARFHHARGSSVPALGYGRFLWIYYRNLERYLVKHHGRGWLIVLRLLLPLSMTLRLALLPLRAPMRAESRLDAARGLLRVAAGAASGWRRPRAWREAFTRRPFGDGGGGGDGADDG